MIMKAYVGISPDGIKRVYGQGKTIKFAKSKAFQAAWDYVKRRPDTGPLAHWRFCLAKADDLDAASFMHPACITENEIVTLCSGQRKKGR